MKMNHTSSHQKKQTVRRLVESAIDWTKVFCPQIMPTTDSDNPESIWL